MSRNSEMAIGKGSEMIATDVVAKSRHVKVVTFPRRASQPITRDCREVGNTVDWASNQRC
jgi:hypothetical protein